MTSTHEKSDLPWEQSFALVLKRLRVAANISLYALARELTVRGLPFHQQQLDRIERGDRPVRLNEAIVIAQYFGRSVEDMTGQGAQPADELKHLTRNLEATTQEAMNYTNEVRRAWLALVAVQERVEGTAAQIRKRSESESDVDPNVVSAADVTEAFTSHLERAFKEAVLRSTQAIESAKMQSTAVREWIGDR